MKENNLKFEYELLSYCCESNFIADVISALCYIYERNLKDEDDYNYSSVAVLCDVDMTEALLKEICLLTSTNGVDLFIDYIDFDTVDYHGEYGFILYIENEQLGLGIEKAKCINDDYKTFDMDYVYIEANCSGDLIINQTMYEGNMDMFVISNECTDY